MTYNYSAKESENAAKAAGTSLPISTKQSINVTKFIRGKKVADAKRILNDSINMVRPIPFTRFLNGAGHKPGMGAGKYAPTTCKAILKLVESAESNAQYKGLNTSNLIIKHISAQKGPAQWRYGRKRRQQMKSTHIEVIVEEVAAEKKEAKKTAPKKEKVTKEAPAKEAPAKVAKKEAPKEAAKPAEKAPAKEAPKAHQKEKKADKAESKKDDKK